MTHDTQDGNTPHMTLPNGDIIREGDYAVTRDKKKVGPLVFGHDSPFATTHPWAIPVGETYRENGLWLYHDKQSSRDLVAKWHPVEPGPDPVAPDYNDGEWHEWHGGECPVHPESVVEAFYRQKDGRPSPESPVTDFAGLFDWKRENAYTLVSFRVVTPYVEPEPDPVAPPAKLWRDMTAAEKGALLLAAHEGKVIEYWKRGTGGWAVRPSVWSNHESYRVKPEPEVVTVTMPGTVASGFSSGHVCETDTHKITFNTIDGKPDCASIRMEPLE